MKAICVELGSDEEKGLHNGLGMSSEEGIIIALNKPELEEELEHIME